MENNIFTLQRKGSLSRDISVTTDIDLSALEQEMHTQATITQQNSEALMFKLVYHADSVTQRLEWRDRMLANGYSQQLEGNYTKEQIAKTRPSNGKVWLINVISSNGAADCYLPAYSAIDTQTLSNEISGQLSSFSDDYSKKISNDVSCQIKSQISSSISECFEYADEISARAKIEIDNVQQEVDDIRQFAHNLERRSALSVGNCIQSVTNLKNNLEPISSIMHFKGNYLSSKQYKYGDVAKKFPYLTIKDESEYIDIPTISANMMIQNQIDELKSLITISNNGVRLKIGDQILDFTPVMLLKLSAFAAE